MPNLQWDELDFLECLEVVPEVEEDGISYTYDVQRGDFRLLVTVRPLESVVECTLWQQEVEASLFDFDVYVRGRVRHINDKRGEYLEFQDSIVVPDRFWYVEAGDLFSPERFALSVTLALRIKPSISLRFV
jgi:hypothetical protein